MSFPTPAFALLMLAFLPMWHALGSRPQARAWLGLGCTVFFLGWAGASSAWMAVGMMALAALCATVSPRVGTLGRAGLCAALLAPLAYFKYGAWIAGLSGAQAGWAWRGPSPLGLSFYTFSSLAWVSAASDTSARASLLSGAAGAFFMPASSSGPVLRPIDAADALASELSPPHFADAAAPFILGLFLKLAISTRLGLMADSALGSPAAQDAWSLALGLHAYAGQLYADFAGYSLMAIGVGRALGVELPSNFEAPYSARGIGEFWRRWHISLSRFWRDRIYIPLGGSRRGRARELVNLMAVMLLCGLWHGAGFCFLAWGAIHGALLCAERAWRWAGAPRLPGWLGWAATFEAVTWAWLPFRLHDAEQLGQAARALGSAPLSFGWPPVLFCLCWLALAAEHVFKEPLLEAARALGRERPVVFAALALAATILCVELSPEGIPPFIYSNF